VDDLLRALSEGAQNGMNRAVNASAGTQRLGRKVLKNLYWAMGGEAIQPRILDESFGPRAQEMADEYKRAMGRIGRSLGITPTTSREDFDQVIQDWARDVRQRELDDLMDSNDRWMDAGGV